VLTQKKASNKKIFWSSVKRKKLHAKFLRLQFNNTHFLAKKEYFA
jgi:hypothetical protein